jgi:DNA-binding ferritin-like protein (Dps family)
MGATAFVAIYQSPQSAYDVFDKVTVLYEGRQIYFGPCNEARQFFVDMGFDPPERQTTPDFLTSLTSPQERKARAGFENRVPRTPDEFVQRWKASETYRRLIAEIEEYNNQYPVGGEALELFKQSRRAQQAKRQYVRLLHSDMYLLTDLTGASNLRILFPTYSRLRFACAEDSGDSKPTHRLRLPNSSETL